MTKIVRTIVLMLVVSASAACGGDDSARSDDKPRTTTTVEAATTTTAAAEPCGGAAAVPDAVKVSEVAGINTVADKFDVADVTVAASDPSWARFSQVPKDGVVDFEGAYGVVHCETDEWIVYDVGSSEVGCGGGTIPEVPPAVRADLGLECPA